MLPNHYNYIDWVMHDLHLVSLLFIAVIATDWFLLHFEDSWLLYLPKIRISGNDDQFTYFSELESEVLQCQKQHNQLYTLIQYSIIVIIIYRSNRCSVRGQGSTQVHMNP